MSERKDPEDFVPAPPGEVERLLDCAAAALLTPEAWNSPSYLRTVREPPEWDIQEHRGWVAAFTGDLRIRVTEEIAAARREVRS